MNLSTAILESLAEVRRATQGGAPFGKVEFDIGRRVATVLAESTRRAEGKQDELYRKTTLENGIRVVTETMPEVRSVTIGIIINASPRDEMPQKWGLAHLIEHAIFQGTSNRDARQIAHLMDVGGGNIGAFTTRDYTCYFASVVDDYRTYALDLLGDILLNSIFPADNLEREKEVILHEIDASRDRPYERAHMLLKAAVWSDHPLGRPIIGVPETVRSLTREDVIYFVHEHYLPNRMIVAAVGNVEHQDFVAQVRDAFWRMQGMGKPVVHDPPAYQAGAKVEHAPVSQAYFSIGMQVYPYAHPNRYALHILNNILGGGISSRLYRRIREERGLVYNIGSEYHAYRDGGLFVIEGSTAPEYLDQVLALTLIELGQLITGDKPADEDELWKAKMQIRGQHLLAAESTNTRMSRLATQEFYFGRHIPTHEILTQIEMVDDQTLKRLTNEVLIKAFKQLAIAVVGPGLTEDYSFPSINELLAGFEGTQKK
jgi:predicted Zn-dependent peptidase